MEDGNPMAGMVILLMLIVISAVISAMKASIMNTNESNVRKKAENGNKSAALLLRVLEQSGRYLNVLEIILNFIGIMIGMTFISEFIPKLEAALRNSGDLVNTHMIRPLYYGLFTVILVLLTVLFGSIIPKKLAVKHAESIAYRSVDLLRLLGFLCYPFAFLLEILMNLLLRLFGIKPSELAGNVTEEELLSMVNVGQEQGVFDAGEVEMISNIIELGDKEARDIMTPKKKIVAVNSEMTLEAAIHFMLSEQYSRYPLYEGNRDNIIGILHMKDMMQAYLSSELKEKPLKELAREPYYVPDTQNINILFKEMKSKNIHMAIVIDEYGQTAGLVAMEDFLEEIVGSIQDEYDEEENMILASEEDSVTVKGSIRLEELEEEKIYLDNKDFDTLNGLLISLLDRIPGDGERITLEYQHYHFEIEDTRNKMIQQVRITRLSAMKAMEKEPGILTDESIPV